MVAERSRASISRFSSHAQGRGFKSRSSRNVFSLRNAEIRTLAVGINLANKFDHSTSIIGGSGECSSKITFRRLSLSLCSIRGCLYRTSIKRKYFSLYMASEAVLTMSCQRENGSQVEKNLIQDGCNNVCESIVGKIIIE